MTEAQWLACTDPTPMLELLEGKVKGRQLRLFAVACCRRVLPPGDNRHYGLDLAEDIAEGRPGPQVSDSSADWQSMLLEGGTAVDSALLEPLREDLAERGLWPGFPGWSAGLATTEPASGAGVTEAAELALQAEYLRCIVGPRPFRRVTIPPAVFAWRDGTVRRLAQALYEERSFDRLPILADALEDAGCTDADILNHCRGEGPHVRGCWVVDLLLGKQRPAI
jgi:hypothetical protein